MEGCGCAANAGAARGGAAKGAQHVANCVREIANWSGAPTQYRFDARPEGLTRTEREALLATLPTASPKLEMLFANIARLDARDQQRHGKRFKHMVFTDVRSNYYGAKLVATTFEAKGYARVIRRDLDLDPNRLRALGGDAFALLCSSTVYRRSIPARYKKELVRLYNTRPDNVYGELIRFIILDQGYKEGIDLYDIKYVHLLEPLLTPADEVQAIGRGTRYCGQKGLPFHPKRGWPLFVYKYDLSIPERLQQGFDDAETLGDLAFRLSGTTRAEVNLAREVDYMVQFGAVDYPLTRAIHDSDVLGAAALDSSASQEGGRIFQRYGGYLQRLSRKHGLQRYRVEPPAEVPATGGGDEAQANQSEKEWMVSSIRKEMSEEAEVRLTQAPATRKGLLQMRALVAGRFARYAWPQATFENLCAPKGGAGNDHRPVKLSPSQEFLRRYFTPASWYKGLLLYHMVGTGKTCSAIAIASSSWEQQGYTILWVTRHTLKADMWKNMYDVICSSVIKRRIAEGDLELPEGKVQSPMRYLSDAWIAPISYKQFSNLLAGKNELYGELVRRNGREDPLRRTLVVVDEAHKLFAQGLQGAEKPDVALIERMVQESYERSGADSVRLLLLTATPFQSDPVDLCRLLNLLRPRSTALPTDAGAFQARYLDEDQHFTERGTIRFLDDISGYVSYLNRQKDARAFAYPVVQEVVEPMSESTLAKHQQELADAQEMLFRVRDDLDTAQASKKRIAATVELERVTELARCAELPDARARTACKKEVTGRVQAYKRALVQEIQDQVKEDRGKQADYQRAVREAKKKVSQDVKMDVSTERGLRERCAGKKEKAA